MNDSIWSDRGLGWMEKLVLLAIAHLYDGKNEVEASYADLSKMTGLSRRSVISAVNNLDAKGRISKATQRPQDGSRAANTYLIIDRKDRQLILNPSLEREDQEGAQA